MEARQAQDKVREYETASHAVVQKVLGLQRSLAEERSDHDLAVREHEEMHDIMRSDLEAAAEKQAEFASMLEEATAQLQVRSNPPGHHSSH